jgi:transposase
VGCRCFGIANCLNARQRHEPRRGVRFDRAAYRERNRLKQHRAIATRYEKLAEIYHALITLSAIQLWLPV